MDKTLNRMNVYYSLKIILCGIHRLKRRELNDLSFCAALCMFDTGLIDCGVYCNVNTYI